MKGAAIYLYERKGKSKEYICDQLDCTKADLALWLLNRETIKSELQEELVQHLTMEAIG